MSRRVGDHSLAQIPARFLQLAECCGSHNAVDDDSAVLLEGTNRGIDCDAEMLGIIIVGADTEKPEPFETVSDLGYRWISDSPRQMKAGKAWEFVNHLG